MRWPIQALKLKTAPVQEPIDLAEMKRFLDIDASDTNDDNLITTLIKSARDIFEEVNSCRLIEQSWYLYLNDWPGSCDIPDPDYVDEIEIPYWPLLSITTFKYFNDSGTEYIFAGWHADTSKKPGRIVLKEGFTWPSTSDLRRSEGIQIDFKCGYGAVTNSVPKGIQLVLKMIVQHLFHNRSEAFSSSLNSMISRYKLHTL